MAKIYQGYSPLRKDYDKHMNRVKVTILVIIACYFLQKLQTEFRIGILVAIIYGLIEYSRAKQYKTGVAGERRVVGLTPKLPPNYTMVTNVELQHEGKTILYDAVIVGPAGVFVVEVKNMNGYVEGYADDYELTQEKTGRNGGSYDKQVKNPLKALSAQIYTMSLLFKHQQFGIWVSGFVLFTNSTVRVNIWGAQTPIFLLRDKGAKKIREYLLQAEKKNTPLSAESQKKVIALLTGKKS